ncbi:hypothetical protein, partial [Mesotoga sp. UBA5847]|uniref:hypothetical protein n=1 Tax=Mesotoga sp. UBA5847 TaxID=1946859 RepID=UPI0025F7083E
NVVFISDQRIFSLKRTAVLMLATWNMQLATVLSKDGSLLLDGQRITSLSSVQRLFRTNSCSPKKGF